MTKKEAQERIVQLKKLINHHRYLYHVLDRQEISEAALDSLKKELFDLEQIYPEFITSDSPTQRVGGRPLEKFGKTKHPQPMLSFNDAFSEEDMHDWLARISKLLTEEERKLLTAPPHNPARGGTGSGGFYCELKIDGLAIELIYGNEILNIGSTRGDGITGENITQNLKTIEAIPLGLREKREAVHALKYEGVRPEIIAAVEKHDFKKPIIVRGEVFIQKKEFEKVNREQQKLGLSTYANPRNLAAGSIRQLDPKITAARRLNSFAYELITDLSQQTHEEKHKILKALGFRTNSHNKYCRNLKEVFDFHQYCQKIREKLNYEIDGIVVIVNSNKIFEKLGVVGKAPKGAVAFKFPLKQATTIIEDIKVQVGRTGALTPVAILKPVQVGGVTISRATLHNEDEIERLGLKIGDTVVVGRAGDVIPDIIKVLPELRTGREKEFKMPKICPLCESRTERKPGEVATYCTNANCFARQREYLYHFVSKKAFDIVGLGPKIIDRLIEEGLISDAADIFELKEGDILGLKRFGKKSAQNLIQAIQKTKKINLPRFIYSLGIRNVGEETAFDLAAYFGNLNKLRKANFAELQRVKDIGPVVAKSISDWFSQKKNVDFLDKLHKLRIKIEPISVPSKPQKLKGLTFVLTGALGTMSREKCGEKIRQLGGDVSSSVSKNTDFVVVGKEPGSKIERAKKLGVEIIEEKKFLGML